MEITVKIFIISYSKYTKKEKVHEKKRKEEEKRI